MRSRSTGARSASTSRASTTRVRLSTSRRSSATARCASTSWVRCNDGRRRTRRSGRCAICSAKLSQRAPSGSPPGSCTRRACTPSHVSHLKVETRPMWGRSEELLELVDAERARGADVTADQYPYDAWETSLASALPPWVTAEELPGVVADAATAQRLFDSIELGEPGWASVGRGIGWDPLLLGSHLADPSLTGRSIADVAAERGIAAAEAIGQLLLADPHTGIVGHAMDEDDVRTIVSRADVFVATDGLAVSPNGPLGAFAVHPRYYGTFPRVLGRYTRQERLLSLEDAVLKMTSLPAARFGLEHRGTIERGSFADLVVFDPERVTDRATFERPHTFADGIDVIIVNGRVAWDGSNVRRHGRALRRGGR